MVLGSKRLPLALELLTETAVVGVLSSDAARFLHDERCAEVEGRGELRDVLDLLEHDGYLRRSDGSYLFVSKLVADWWRRRFGFGYRPVSRRRGEDAT